MIADSIGAAQAATVPHAPASLPQLGEPQRSVRCPLNGGRAESTRLTAGRNLGYGLAMTATIRYDDDYEEEGLRPSLAYPPLYLLRTVARCPKCRKTQHVYTLGCTTFHDAHELRPVEAFHFQRLIHSVPQRVLDLLNARSPGFFLDQEEVRQRLYLMNHCVCGASLDDDYLHGDVDAAFMPDTPEGYENFELFLLPIDEVIPVESSYALGGGEYLDFAKVEPW